MRNVLFAAAFAALLVLAGCAQEQPQVDEYGCKTSEGEAWCAERGMCLAAGEECTSQMVGNDRDEHGCIPSAGYSWCESKQMCVRPWETPCPALSESQARSIAESSSCMQEGGLTGQSMYNENSKTWWFDMDTEKPGCAPACVVSEDDRTAEINWRCTGALMPDESQVCAYAPSGYSLTLGEAKAIGEASGSVCMVEGTLDMSDVLCNENTGTWWIGLVPTVVREGCSPACVVNVNSGTAEVNWRCTGLNMEGRADALPAINEGGGACMFSANGKMISFARAREVASRNSSICRSVGTLNMAEYLCDSDVGKMYYRINPTLPIDDCIPMCVVNVNSETSDVEWKCATG